MGGRWPPLPPLKLRHCRAKIATTFGMKLFADVLLIISASGYREYLTIKTIIYCPVEEDNRNQRELFAKVRQASLASAVVQVD